MNWVKKTALVLFALLSLGTAAASGWIMLNHAYLRIGTKFHSREVTVLDLQGEHIPNPRQLGELSRLVRLNLTGTGVSPADYQYLKEQLPECEIEWDLLFQGDFYPLDTHSIQVSHLTEADVESLKALPELYHVNGWDCTDYAAIQLLMEELPECSVFYQIYLGRQAFFSDERQITVTNADSRELIEKLRYFPGLEEVILDGYIPNPTDMQALQDAYPRLDFACTMPRGMLELDHRDTLLDLSSQNLTAGQVRELIAYFPECGTVNLMDSPLSEAELRELADAYPQRFFLFTMVRGNKDFPTDSVELDLSGVPLENVEELEAMIPYFPFLNKLVVCGCGLDSEELAQLNDKWEDIRIIWDVAIGALTVRTDITSLMPAKTHTRVYEGDLDNLKYCPDLVCLDLGHMSIQNVEFLRYLPNLKYLVLADTLVSDISPIENCKKLVFLELFLSHIKDTTPLTGLTELEDLNLCYVDADPEPIGEMTWLKRLWWSGSWRARTTLSDLLADTEMEFNSPSSTGGTWRMGKRYYEMRDILGMGYMIG